MSREFFEVAYRKYWDKQESNSSRVVELCEYELCDEIRRAKWYVMADFMVEGELREATNLMNSWRLKLLQWEGWIDVLDEYGEDDAWQIRSHFVESIAYFCMFQPSAVRDRIARIATNSIHQANLSIDKSYVDRLDGDDPEFRGRFSRKNIEKQLERIGSRWANTCEFLCALRRLDSAEYRKKNVDWRNLASHSLAPRFEIGHVQAVTRSIVPRSFMVEQPDGTFKVELDTQKKSVSYGFGGIPPLSLKGIYAANLEQFEAALKVHKTYERLIQEFVRRLPKSNDTNGTPNN